MDSFSVVVLGAGGVGKSALTLRFTRNEFVDLYDPTIEESFQKIFKLSDRTIAMDILDTAGAEQFHAISEFYLRGADGFVLVFSLTSGQTLQELEKIRDQVLRVKNLDTQRRVPMIIVGTKSDLLDDIEVRPATIRAMKESWKVHYCETSAKRGTGVTEAFGDLAHQMIAMRDKKRRPKTSSQGHSHGHNNHAPRQSQSYAQSNGFEQHHHRSKRKGSGSGSGSCTII